MKTSNLLLTFIFIALVAVFGFMVYEESQDSPIENVAESVNETAEEITN